MRVPIRWRYRRMGISTVMGWARRGFFIPYRYADTVPEPGDSAPYPAIERLFGAAADGFRAELAALDDLAADLLAIGPDRPPQPRWNQDWFPSLDAAIAYRMVRRRAPRRIVEVGSGHSTRFLARAIADGGLDAELQAIDPAPRAVLGDLKVVWRRQVLDAAIADRIELGAGDILFIDSSHVLMPGTDVDLLLNRVLPRLPAGALVHLHDIMLPDDYPRAWAWRGYNEQNAVAALLGAGTWRPLFASHYVGTRLADDLANSLAARLPTVPLAYPSSLWLERQ